MTINIENEYGKEFDFDTDKLIESVILKALDYAGCPYEACVNVLITDDDSIHEINREYRQIDRPTDVLSFPMAEYEVAGNFDFLEGDDAFDCFDPESGEFILGDIILSGDRIISQAEEYGHSIKREMSFLVAHSMFHLFGYDHMTEEEAADMERMQESVLKELGITRKEENYD